MVTPYTGYDDKTNPSIPNAFSAAAYRFGHSQIQPAFERLGNDGPISEGPLPLVDAFFNTTHIRKLGTDPILRGLLLSQARKVDEFMNNVLTNYLFADSATAPGLDLASLNIQRGRDHGIPTYPTWKQWAKRECEVESEFRSAITQTRLLRVYGSLDNVDLFVGGLAEIQLPGSLVGAVFACIFSKTFVGLRDGDRFFYDNADPDTALFSAEQREQLNKASLSRVICDNTDIVQIQPNAFQSTLSYLPCSELNVVDLTPWTSAPELPDMCYIKVSSSKTSVYYSTSRRINAGSSDDYDFHQQIINSGSDVCLPIKCPQQGGETIFAVSSWQNSNCAPRQNPSLPATLNEIPGNSLTMTASVYIQQLDASEFSQDGNGLYVSLNSCNSATHIGLDYSCNAKPGYTSDESISEEIQMLADKVEQITARGKMLLAQLNEEMPSSDDEESDKKVVETASDDSLVLKLESILKKLDE